MANEIINSNLIVIETALSFPEKARILTITDEATFLAANEFLVADKQMQKLVHSAFDPTVDATKEAHNMALVQRARYLNPLLEAERIAKPKLGAWLTEQARIRQEAVEKARREAAEAERKRLAVMQAAIDAENAGKTKEAEEKFEEALAVEPPKPVIPELVKVQGTFLRKDLKWRVVDLAAVPLEFMALDRAKVEQVFRVQREKMSISGVEVFEESVVVSRAS
jgi:hypothetical protein